MVVALVAVASAHLALLCARKHVAMTLPRRPCLSFRRRFALASLRSCESDLEHTQNSCFITASSLPPAYPPILSRLRGRRTGWPSFSRPIDAAHVVKILEEVCPDPALSCSPNSDVPLLSFRAGSPAPPAAWPAGPRGPASPPVPSPLSPLPHTTSLHPPSYPALRPILSPLPAMPSSRPLSRPPSHSSFT